MSDKDLCKMFGTTLEYIENDVAKYEGGDLPNFSFGEPLDGEPGAKTKTGSVKFFDFELAAIDKAAAKEGISRSAFIRRACDNELIALA